MLQRFVLAGVVAGSLALAAPAEAQGLERAPSSPPPPVSRTIDIAPYAGYMIYGDWVQGPVGTRLANANGPVYGAQLALHLTPNVAVVGNVAHSRADLQVGLPILGGLTVANSSMWMYDGGIQLSAPLGSRTSLPVTPFVQVGAGAIHTTVEQSLFQTDATSFAFNAGVGADIALGPSVGLRLMAKDYVGKFDFQEATGLGVAGNRAHNWALSAGVRIGF
jgi:hypothetical protein